MALPLSAVCVTLGMKRSRHSTPTSKDGPSFHTTRRHVSPPRWPVSTEPLPRRHSARLAPLRCGKSLLLKKSLFASGPDVGLAAVCTRAHFIHVVASPS